MSNFTIISWEKLGYNMHSNHFLFELTQNPAIVLNFEEFKALNTTFCDQEIRILYYIIL